MYRTILQRERWFGPNYGKKQTACGCKVNVGVPDRLSHLPLLWQMGHQPDTMQCLQNMNATTFSKSHWRECPLLPATVAPPRPQPVYKLYNCQGQCLGCLMVSPTLTNEVCLCSLVRFSNHYFCWSIGEPVLPPLQPSQVLQLAGSGLENLVTARSPTVWPGYKISILPFLFNFSLSGL